MERNGERLVEPTPRISCRSPEQQEVLLAVVRGEVEWCTTVGPSGGFVRKGGMPVAPVAKLVALYELRDAGLIAVDVNYGRVTATSAGLATMAQWSS
jgi:hypothetical protein